MGNVKQIIVVRKYFPDGKGGTRKVRLGKEFSQISHASMAFLTTRLYGYREIEGSEGITEACLQLSPEELEWLEEGFTKVCTSVDTEEELLELCNKCEEAGLTVHKIIDSGHTEFNGVSTLTVAAIGPHEDEKLSPFTGDLKLL